jgi:hypothetical protein
MLHTYVLAECLERLTANENVLTVLGSLPASSDTSVILGSADAAVLNKVLSKNLEIPLKKEQEYII